VLESRAVPRTVTSVRIGALVPNSGPLPLEVGIPAMAARLEAAGFESLWVSDHIVLPASIESHYPFAADGRATWPSTTPYVDALIALALMAAATERATLGTAVLVLPLRHPVVFAKQAASIDVASGGRLQLGVGAGWLREEFDALNVPFEDRGRRLVEWMEIARDCWTGTPAARSSERYTLPEGVLCLPTPARPIPFLMGGHSPAALRRAGRLAAGWLAQQSLSELDPDALGEGADAMRAAAKEAGRDPDHSRVVLRLVESAGRAEEIASVVPALVNAGVDEIVVNVDWEDEDAAGQYTRMRS
jgi:probable F420-dependent oxidoreductase